MKMIRTTKADDSLEGGLVDVWLIKCPDGHRRMVVKGDAEAASSVCPQCAIGRLKRLLGQCMERQASPPVMLTPLDSQHLDNCINEAVEVVHKEYRPLFWRLCWRQDYSL